MPRRESIASAGARVHELLRFPDDCRFLRTPFRERVLNYIFRTALGSLGSRLNSASVSVSSVPDEKDTYALDLTLVVSGDWSIASEARDAILAKVSDWSEEWSSEQHQDYGRRIFFSLIPSEL